MAAWVRMSTLPVEIAMKNFDKWIKVVESFLVWVLFLLVCFVGAAGIYSLF